ncbi:mechanosensitive ion channel domain-containing protein [Granulicoccus phenolivorans]|uniref:mechanosensitive ion channel domain-containing protein n=2 Tax=Granulicoccus phenolivorans TaxID=266854 RepID=UPI0007676D07|nr:mechanosensitive ion channel domain-containing protein [Granulicoccus phenolivorans]
MNPLALTLTWPDTYISLVLIFVLAVVARVVLNQLIKRVVASAVKRSQGKGSSLVLKATGVNVERSTQRTETMGSLLRNVVTVVIVVTAGLTAFQVIGLPLGPVLASAGIGGLAIGFGAQSLVKDVISGIFMIVEDQYGVGDVVDTGDVVGTVEEVTLRVTQLRDYNGVVWYVRNGEIKRIANKSQGWSTATVDVPIASDEDPQRVIELLNGVVDRLYADPDWEPKMLERPTVLGVERIEGGTMTLRITGRCAAEEHWGVQRQLTERAQQALIDGGVRGPILPLVPSPTEPARPAKPKATGSEAPKATGSEAPKATGSEAPKATGSEAPKATGSEAPKATGSDA